MSERAGQTRGPRPAGVPGYTAGLERVARANAEGTFSSGFGSAALSMCLAAGGRPLAQVMGACASVVGVSGVPVFGDPGYHEYFSRRASPDAMIFELRRISSVYKQRPRDSAGANA